MHQLLSFPVLLLSAILFLGANVSREVADEMRSSVIAFLAPAWKCAAVVKEYVSDRPICRNRGEEPLDVAKMRLENYAIRTQLELAKEWIFFENNRQRGNELLQNPTYQKTLLRDQLQRQAQSLLGRVIYRDPSSWSNCLWINVGEADNAIAGFSLVARNSPVVDGDALIGVIDYVGKRQSRVRLITDLGLVPSVRVARGFSSQRHIHYLLDALSDRLADVPECAEDLERLKRKIGCDLRDVYLAKGELHGNGLPFWQFKPVLKGTGFNYDYPDAEGCARDLRTGKPVTGSGNGIALIQEKDHLITSGLDGVFPAGLSVAIVKKVLPLQEGSVAYNIEATPTASSLHDLQCVFVLPPLEEGV